jgi:hypothetical protein
MTPDLVVGIPRSLSMLTHELCMHNPMIVGATRRSPAAWLVDRFIRRASCGSPLRTSAMDLLGFF